jgi:dihydropteroate synthase
MAALPLFPIAGLPRGEDLSGPLEGRLYLEPAGILHGAAAQAAIASGHGWSLAGGATVFTACIVYLRQADRVLVSVAPFGEILSWSENEGQDLAENVAGRLRKIGGRRPPFAGFTLDRPRIMGIVNVTPDSFSDGGRFFETERAIKQGVALRDAGADIVDVGGESTKPGADAVAPEEEISRILPVIRALVERDVVVSVDTRHAAVMAAALDAGARIVNDVAALTEPGALDLVAARGAPVILMHMQGDPRSMQQDPRYACAPLDIFDFLATRINACLDAGIPAGRLCVDPGIGFGKTVAHNLQVLARLGLYHGLGVPVLLGASRKSFIGKLSGGMPADQRLPGSLTAALSGIGQGVQIVRVHDVAETKQALSVGSALTD